MVNLTRAHIILAGGRSKRLGSVAKCGLQFGDLTLLEHSLTAGHGSCHQVVVGPPDLPVPDGVRLVREDPPFGGPVAGIAAGVAELERAGCDAECVLITACDHPRAEAAAVALLARWGTDPLGGSSPQRVDLVTPTDSTGHRQTLFALYRRSALITALADCDGGHNVSVRRLISTLRTVAVPLPDDLLDDVDDPATAARLGITVPRKEHHAPRP